MCVCLVCVVFVCGVCVCVCVVCVVCGWCVYVRGVCGVCVCVCGVWCLYVVCVCVCDLGTLTMRRPRPGLFCCSTKRKQYLKPKKYQNTQHTVSFMSLFLFTFEVRSV